MSAETGAVVENGTEMEQDVSENHNALEEQDDFFGCRAYSSFLYRVQLINEPLLDELEDSLNGKALKKESADWLAQALYEWASGEHGAQNFVLWAHPYHSTAAQFETFLKPVPIDSTASSLEMSNAVPVETLTSSRLFQRVVHIGSNRGKAYLRWDQSSPPFVQNETLYIPATAVDAAGHALDDKTPLLRSQAAVSSSARRLVRLLGDQKTHRIASSVSWEQKFSLVDQDVYYRRPDFVETGRSLFLDDKRPFAGGGSGICGFPINNMGAEEREIMGECQRELHHLGVPLKSFEKTNVPLQFKIGSHFAPANVSVDQNILALQALQECAFDRGRVALFNQTPLLRR